MMPSEGSESKASSAVATFLSAAAAARVYLACVAADTFFFLAARASRLAPRAMRYQNSRGLRGIGGKSGCCMLLSAALLRALLLLAVPRQDALPLAGHLARTAARRGGAVRACVFYHGGRSSVHKGAKQTGTLRMYH